VRGKSGQEVKTERAKTICHRTGGKVDRREEKQELRKVGLHTFYHICAKRKMQARGQCYVVGREKTYVIP